jgi:hypothetical protein
MPNQLLVVPATIMLYKDEGWFADTAICDGPERYIHLRKDGYCEEAMVQMPDGNWLTGLVRVPEAPLELAPGTLIMALALERVYWNWKACTLEFCSGCRDYCRRSSNSIRQATRWTLSDRNTTKLRKAELFAWAG